MGALLFHIILLPLSVLATICHRWHKSCPQWVRRHQVLFNAAFIIERICPLLWHVCVYTRTLVNYLYDLVRIHIPIFLYKNNHYKSRKKYFAMTMKCQVLIIRNWSIFLHTRYYYFWHFMHGHQVIFLCSRVVIQN